MSNTTIRFPYLGIELHPGKYIDVFGIRIAFYGMLIGLAMLVGAAIAYREAKKTGQNVEDYIDFTLWSLILAIVGARLYYVIFEWDYYKDNLLEIVIGIRNGGLAIYGGVIASLITLFVFTRVRKLNFWQMADTACLGLVAGQIIGRWGNFFNREAFGGYTNSIFAMQLPVSEANGVTSDLLRNSYIYNGASYIQVHPTFLYEGLWNLGVLSILLCYKKHKKFHGELFALYLVGYGIGRAWIEGLRTDQLIMKGLNLPVSQILSVVLVILAIIFIIYNRTKLKKNMQVAGVNTVAAGGTKSDKASSMSGIVTETIIENEESANSFHKQEHTADAVTVEDLEDGKKVLLESGDRIKNV